MLYEASHNNIEKVSDQAWNHVAATQIKAYLRGFCFGLLSVFVSLSLCCPGCLSLVVITLMLLQFWRGDEASVVLSPLQNMLELMCTDSFVNGEGETLACPLWLAQGKRVHLGELSSNWQTSGTASQGNPRNRASEKLPPVLFFSRKEIKNLCYFVWVGLFNTTCCQLLRGRVLDMILWCASHSQFNEDAPLAQLPTTYVMETMSIALEVCVC